MSRNILVTGAAGFIGSNYIDYHKSVNPEDKLYVVDSFTYAANIDNLDIDNVEKIEIYNICDYDKLFEIFREYNISDVIHFAAESHVDNSIKNPTLFYETNLIGTINLLECFRLTKCPGRFHHISTDEVYGSLGLDDAAFTEDSQYQPNSPYSSSKAASDHAVNAYHHTYGMNTTISNCSNNYGKHQHNEKLIPKVIFNALSGLDIGIYGNGSNIRDWLYVEDHCSAINLIFNTSVAGKTYIIGDNKEFTNNEIVDIILNKLDSYHPRKDGISYKTQIKYIENRAGHDFRYAINANKIKSELGWKPVTEFDDAITNTIGHYVEKFISKNNPIQRTW